MMPSNDFPGGNLIYCHWEEMEKKDLGEGGGGGDHISILCRST